MKQGKYYRAADTFTLAAIYDNTNPIALVGRSHALLAAGEFMSSSYFLSQAIAFAPEYAEQKIDLVQLFGNDRDMFEDRIISIKRWQERGDSAELAFLLAYIFYNSDNLSDAKIAIDKAMEKMSDSDAVISLNDAIAAAANRSK